MTDEMNSNHIRRIKNNEALAEAGSKYLALASDLERIGDHINNVAKTIR
mgnify:CR=1 FL=1